MQQENLTGVLILSPTVLKDSPLRSLAAVGPRGIALAVFFSSHLEQIMHFYVILTSAILAGCVNAQFSLQFGTNAPAPAQISGKNNPFNTIYFKEINFRGMIGKLSWSSRIFRGNALNTSMLIRSRIGYSEEASNMADCSKKMIRF